jgi:Leucine-rich repeat (LRR) protein
MNQYIADNDDDADNGDAVLKVLYLYGNYIEEIENLGFAESTLTHLYLQHNRIAAIQNIPQGRLMKL